MKQPPHRDTHFERHVAELEAALDHQLSTPSLVVVAVRRLLENAARSRPEQPRA